MFLPATQIWPLVASSWRLTRRMNVDFPEPDGPTRKTNSPFSMLTSTSRRAAWSFL